MLGVVTAVARGDGGSRGAHAAAETAAVMTAMTPAASLPIAP